MGLPSATLPCSSCASSVSCFILFSLPASPWAESAFLPPVWAESLRQQRLPPPNPHPEVEGACAEWLVTKCLPVLRF